MERCKHVKSQANTVYFKLGTLRRVSTYVQHVWGIIGHVTAEAGNKVGTDGAPPQVPPQTLRRQAQRLSRFGGRAARSGRLDTEEVVVGGAVGGKLNGTCRCRPAMSAAARKPVAPAQRGVPCAAAVQVARASSAT